MPYEYLDDVAIADVAFHAWGADLAEVFRAAWEATLAVMVSNPEAVALRETRTFTLENDALDMLLFNFLQEAIYLKDAEQLLLHVESLEVFAEGNGHCLHAVAAGEQLDPDRHEQVVDVKAVTLYDFQLKPTDHGWQATVVLDI